MIKKNRKRLAGVAALFVALICSNGHIIHLPDFLAGFVTGFAIVLVILSMLPDQVWEKLRRWKRRGS